MRALAVASTLLLPASALAWSPIAESRPTWSAEAPYAVHSAGSDDLDLATVLREVRRAMGDWARVDCTSLAVRYTGETTLGSDSRNVIAWTEEGWTGSATTIGVTYVSWDHRGRITSSRMALNGEDYTWNVGGGWRGVDTYSLILHEGGHYIGLGHSEHVDAAMYYAYSHDVDHLTDDDVEGVCALYPGEGGTTGDCVEDAHCGPGRACVDFACVAVRPDAPTCAPCAGDADCAAGGICMRYADGGMHCGRACASDTDCGDDTCEAITTGALQCIRRHPSTRRPDCSFDCVTDADCGAGEACVDAACVEREAPPPPPPARPSTCDPCASSADCDEGGVCMRYPDGGRFCGAPCAAHADCGDDTCEAISTGVMQCIRRHPHHRRADCDFACGGSADCDAGEACEGGVCVVPEPSVCTPCDTSADCVSGGVCMRFPDGGKHCGAPCDTAADCEGDDTCDALSTGARQCIRRRADRVADCRESTTDARIAAPATSPAPAFVAGTATASGPDPEVVLEVGEACRLNAQCASGVCLVDEGLDGACVAPCDARSACAEGLACERGLCPPGTAPAPRASPEVSGCAATGGSGGRGAAALVLLGVVLSVRRRALGSTGR